MFALEVFLGVASRLRDLEGELRRRQLPDRARVVGDLAARYEATLQKLESVEARQRVHTSAQPLVKRARYRGP